MKIFIVSSLVFLCYQEAVSASTFERGPSEKSIGSSTGSQKRLRGSAMVESGAKKTEEDKKIEEEIEKLNTYVRKGQAWAMIELADLLSSIQNYEKAAQVYYQAGETGDEQALSILDSIQSRLSMMTEEEAIPIIIHSLEERHKRVKAAAAAAGLE
jgi:hypothetical protein